MDEFVKPLVAPPASVLHEVEVAEIKLLLQDPAREKQQARLVPLGQKLSNEVRKQVPHAPELPLSQAVAIDGQVKPVSGESWVS